LKMIAVVADPVVVTAVIAQRCPPASGSIAYLKHLSLLRCILKDLIGESIDFIDLGPLVEWGAEPPWLCSTSRV
jgi:hypothetical protein